MRVLQVEDDEAAARGTELVFRSAGAIVESTETGAEALDYLRAGTYDIVIVDLRLPDMPGQEFVRKLRARGIDTPVAILSGHSSIQAKMAAFEVGADDFIAKPAEAAELVARVRAIVRRNLGFSRNILREGELELDQDRRLVTVGDTAVDLTRKEYELLELLLLRRGRVVSKSLVLDHLYGSADGPASRTVEVFLCHLRRKIDRAGMPGLIKTVTGIGYSIARTAEPAVAASGFRPKQAGSRDKFQPAA